MTSSFSAHATSLLHDFRNPLTAIQAGAELLNQTSLSERQIRRIARNLHSASVQLEKLVEEFLERSRGKVEREVIEFRELAFAAVNEIVSVAESQSVKVSLDIPLGLVVCRRPAPHSSSVNEFVDKCTRSNALRRNDSDHRSF